MNFANITKDVGRTLSKTVLATKKHSPEILIVAGITGIVIGTIEACKATKKVAAVTEEAKDRIAAVKESNADISEESVIDEKKYKKDLTIAYLKGGLDFVKLYGPSVVIETASLVCLLSSYGILKKRNAAIAAAYATIESGFTNYRKKVVEKLGDKADKEFLFGIKDEEIKEKVVDPETGKEKTVKKTIEVADTDGNYSPYAKYFDQASPWFDKNDHDYNLDFLIKRQREANIRLQANGYLFLNDVYDMLGIPRTKIGQFVGWLYKSEKGDGIVDFGVHSLHRKSSRDFVNGYERVILLDFNAEGDITDKIEFIG